MKLTTVLASVNNNPSYYLFIPKQILFWKKFNINFYAVFVGSAIPEELVPYSKNIILWNENLDLNHIFVSQNLRIYYTALFDLPDDELIMITDMDMLPTNSKYYCSGLEHFQKDDFIYYRHIDPKKQIYMCYNAAHPSVWKNVFNINSKQDIINRINETYQNNYNGIPGSTGWFIDQEIMYNNLINYPHLKVLNRPLVRLEVWDYVHQLNSGNTLFISKYDDFHIHRSYINNLNLIMDCENQLNSLYS